MKRITCTATLFSAILFAAGCGQRAADEPVGAPPDTPPVEKPRAEPADQPAVDDLAAPVASTDPVMPEEPAVPPDPGEVDQKKVLGAVGNSLLGTFGLGGDKGSDDFEEAPPF